MCVFVCFPVFSLFGAWKGHCCIVFLFIPHIVCFFFEAFVCIIEVLRVHYRETAHFHDEFQCPVNSCALRSLDVAEKSYAKSEPKGMMADDGWL